MNSSEQILYFSTFLLLGVIFLGSLQFLKMFIKSRPPGRKLVGSLVPLKNLPRYLQVTADIHIYQATAFQFALGIFTLANLVRSFTFAGFLLTFVWIELIKFAAFQVMSWASVSSFLHIAFIFDFR